jgi:hypothetical protein
MSPPVHDGKKNECFLMKCFEKPWRRKEKARGEKW